MEPLTSITAEQKYEELLRVRSNPEFAKVLTEFKLACDKIEAIKGKMSYASVAKIANRHVNTIKADAKGHRAYIILRQMEYEAKSKTTHPVKAKEQELKEQKPRYPASNLDAKTKCFIDELWLDIEDLKIRKSLLESTITEIKREVLNKTLEEPLDARKMLKTGASTSGTMAIVVANEDAPMILLTPKLKEAFESVLKLQDHHKSIHLGINGALMLDTPSKNIVLMYPSELQAIASVLRKEVPSGLQ